MNKDYRILSVQRLSDGEVFSVGDELIMYVGGERTTKIDEIIADETYEGGLAVIEQDDAFSWTSIKSTAAITIIKKAK